MPDRLSSLPDEVLEHILSYLPTKDAVATSFLSKRWKSQSLWRSLMNLRLDDKTFPGPFSFSQFVHSVITKRDNTLPIHSFHLDSRYHFYYINYPYDFVYAAITRGVQNLSIDFSHSDSRGRTRKTLPTFVLTTKTLSVLKLKKITFNEISYKDDPCFDLPSLKVLHLESVTFTYSKHIRKLLSVCPILEELETKDLTVKKTLMELAAGTDVLSLSNLVRANISSGHIEFDWLHNVHHLCIKRRWIHCLDGNVMFHNLIHMELIFDCSYHSGWGRLIKVLQNFPKLQTMIIIDEIDIAHNYGDGEWKDPKNVPECLLSHLTTCSLGNYIRTNCQFQVAKYIMQNSRVLSTMTFQIGKSVESDTKIQMCKELSLCPRNSVTCKLLFI